MPSAPDDRAFIKLFITCIIVMDIYSNERRNLNIFHEQGLISNTVSLFIFRLQRPGKPDLNGRKQKENIEATIGLTVHAQF